MAEQQNGYGLTRMAEDCHVNAVEHGFYGLENKIVWKAQRGMIFSYQEVQALKNAFRCQRLLLIISEVTEAMEALRNENMVEYPEEIADIAIRLADFAGNENINLGAEVRAKMEANGNRPQMHGGKLF